MASNYMEVLLVLALEVSYYDSVSQGSCTREKGIILFQNKDEGVCQFYGRPFEEDGDDDKEIDRLSDMKHIYMLYVNVAPS